MMICYVDESGVPEIPGNTSHYILCGLSISVGDWRNCDEAVAAFKRRYGLADQEIHTAWMMRAYREQETIANFAQLPPAQRRQAVTAARTREIHRLQRLNQPALYKQTKKNFQKTEPYIHLTRAERSAAIRELAQTVAGWGYARLFAECVDKAHFAALVNNKTPDEQAFEQLVTRFEAHLQNVSRWSNNVPGPPPYGFLVHDNNETVAKRHTALMRRFHTSGTAWREVRSIIETPLFVDSHLTSMVQIADLCSYALRRYLENQEEDLFDLIFTRADRVGTTAVGVRHFTDLACVCKICAAHRRPVIPIVAGP